MSRTRLILFLVVGTTFMGTMTAGAATLQKETRRAFESYVALTEARIERELDASARDDGGGFLAIEGLAHSEKAEALRLLREGAIYKRRIETLDAEGRSIEVRKGMVHHWVGAVLVPEATVDGLLAWITDYDEHERYFDEVERSKLLSRDGAAYDVFLRLRRTKVITVHYNTEHEVVYREHGPGRVSSRSRATRIAEVVDAGSPGEREKTPGDDRGFLWRLNSYWRFEEVEGGVIVECETVSLSRGIPGPLRWALRRYIESVPRESLDATLEPIRSAYGDKSTFVQASSLRSKTSYP